MVDSSLRSEQTSNGNVPDLTGFETSELSALQAENRHLKKLVVYLSKNVIENVVDGGPNRRKLREIASLALGKEPRANWRGR